MITLQAILARGKTKAGDDIVDYLLSTPTIAPKKEQSVNYYHDATQDDLLTMRWGGRMASTLKLANTKVDKADMMQLVNGFAPDGTKLVQNAGQKPETVLKFNPDGTPRLDKDGNQMTVEKSRRAGYDLTHSAPKSVSLLFMIADEETKRAILECQNKAVATSMQYFEDAVETRTGAQGKDFVKAKGIVYSQHNQFANRNLEPHLHSHCLIYNVCERPDGSTGSLDATELYRLRKSADMLYQNQLAMELRKRGFAINQSIIKTPQGEDTGQRSWEIQGLHDPDLIEAMSSRHREIVEAKAQGLSDKEAWAKTRAYKDEPDYETLIDHFKELREALAEKFTVPSLEDLKKQQSKVQKAKDGDEILELLHATTSVIERQEILTQLGMEHLGNIEASELKRLHDEFLKRSDLIEIPPHQLHEDDALGVLGSKYTESRYASRKILDKEVSLITIAKEREQETNLQIPLQTMTRVVAEMEKKKGFKISDEQRQGILKVCVESAGTAVIEGYAGTGKTTVSEFYSEVFKAEGFRLQGCAPSNLAAQKLQEESGMPCCSTEMMIKNLEKGKTVLTDKDVLVVDEAGMCDLRTIEALSKFCKSAGAKLVLQGDNHQIQPVGAGQGMALVTNEIGSSVLTEIRRQKSKEDRDIAYMFYDLDENGRPIPKNGPKSKKEVQEKSRNIYQALKDRGCIDEYTYRNEAVQALVDDYFNSTASDNDKLVMAHSNNDLKEINEKIRQGFKDRGLIFNENFKIKAMGKTDFVDMDVSVGDKIRFNTKDNDLKVVNGTEAKITKIRVNKIGSVVITAMVDDGKKGREVTFDTALFNAISHNYARTVHGAQGQGKKDIFLLSNPGMTDNSSALVAFTRLKDGRFKMYGDADGFEVIEQRLGLDRDKENITTIAKQAKATNEAITNSHVVRKRNSL